MCGIAGFAGLELAAQESGNRVREMCDAILHRGPDSGGYFVAEGVALGMRRLSIIDVAGGAQPIYNETETVAVVFNGEIYNHKHLRRDLEARGHKFATHSDTEVLVHLYEEYGAAMLPLLKGMFGFAIWDIKEQKLLVARDRTGMKPLSYRVTAGGVLFCSELRSLAAFDQASLDIDPHAVTQYLAFGYVPDPLTIFSGVRKLGPGAYFTWTRAEGVREVRYWVPPQPNASLSDPTQLIDELRIRLDTAVASHLESEVPLGAFLSGGLDSSTVVALMSRHATGRVKTFSIGFAEAQYDESASAREVAEFFGTDHTQLIVAPNAEAMFDSVVNMFDEPFADPSAVPTFLVAQLARQRVTVALSGDGGDELFGGYRRYADVLNQGIADPSPIDKLLGSAALMLPHFVPWRNRMVNLGRSRWGRYAATVVSGVRKDEGGIAHAKAPAGTRTIEEFLQPFLLNEIGTDFAASMMRIDLQTYLPGDILTKVDRTSMAVSLEARVPLLDCELVDFALQIPGELRVSAMETKRLFRKAISSLVPKSVLSRPKRGFEMPLDVWFRGPLRHRIEALRVLPSSLRDFVDGRAAQRLIREHLMGRRSHGGMLWRLIVLDTWLKNFRAGHLAAPPIVPRSLAT